MFLTKLENDGVYRTTIERLQLVNEKDGDKKSDFKKSLGKKNRSKKGSTQMIGTETSFGQGLLSI
jgi:hypothetical protein